MYRINIEKHDNNVLNQIIVTNADLNFKSIIFPNLGASLQKLSYNGTEIIDGINATENDLEIYNEKFNSSFLFPFPSRIEDGKFNFNGNNYQLELNEKALNNALHGHIYDKNFTLKNKLVSKRKAKLKLRYNYKGTNEGFPFPYKITITYIFTKEGVKIRFKVENTGNQEFPFGLGWHPYFKTSNLNSASLDFNAASQIKFNDRMVPLENMPVKIKTPFKIEKEQLDHCFITNESKAFFKTEDYSLKMKFSSKPPNSYLQVYTPPARTSIAIEPMTCGGNVFNSKLGLKTLMPKDSYQWKVNLIL